MRWRKPSGFSVAVLGIDHVQLAMPKGGEAAARGFYLDVLGLSEIPKPTELAKRGGCWFANEAEGGNAHIHLGVEEPFRPALKAHPALLVDDLAAMRETLRAAGMEFSEGTPLAGYERGDIKDPFGNRIELMQHV
jgi:catechol 2,3-dioxygenase-like lactoylglutathione lyase family enzyme